MTHTLPQLCMAVLLWWIFLIAARGSLTAEQAREAAALCLLCAWASAGGLLVAVAQLGGEAE